MSATQICYFPGTATKNVRLSDVGGKALSLIKTANAGLAVPPGFVLAVDFFADWLAHLQLTEPWQRFSSAIQGQGLQESCEALKKEARCLRFNQAQTEAVSEAAQVIYDSRTHALFAVRSSSPEEDLEGSSFAGGYETILGVQVSKLEEAINRAFASCLDYRVAVYKQQNGFDVHTPKIAVIVQLQVAAEVAGVGFSLNPVTNNFDEAVINSNWGLGETVVAGLATPDTFAVNKITGEIVQRVLGKKESTIFLRDDGGTESCENLRRDEPSLTDEQIVSVTHLATEVERLYEKPMDIEWAISMGELFLLQARPITAYIPVPPEMVTAPAAPKRLYLDATISVQGLYKPISVMGTSVLRSFMTRITRRIFGRDILENIEDSPAIVTSGRTYLNLSNALEIAGKDRFVQLFQNMDPLAAKTVQSIDNEEYRSQSKHFHLIPLPLLWHLPEIAYRLLEACLLPEQANRRCLQQVQKHMRELREFARKDQNILEFMNKLADRTGKMIIGHTLPLFLASRLALEEMKGILGDELVAAPEFNSLQKSLPNNPTVEMGLALYQLSRLLSEEMDVDTLEQLLRDGQMPGSFTEAWNEYMEKYGHRGAVELDIASARFRDNPRTLLEQLVILHKTSTAEDNPQARFDRNQLERHAAFKSLARRIQVRGWLPFQRLKSLYKVYENLAGYRELHKYLVIFAISLLRTRLVNNAYELVAAGKLDAEVSIFDLTLVNVDDALSRRPIDLRRTAASNRIFIDKLEAVRQLPTVFDSRGKILRPPATPPVQGEVTGTAISTGIARGPIKVLHYPDEKPLLKGDILVARATDPGWTPLFVNAAAVILEIGGMLQHGALVAREYGLPCVAGIENATELWTDGTLVEVDGADGVVRLCNSDCSSPN